MTTQQQTDFQNNVYSTVNISGSGSPARGYWIVAGFSGASGGIVGGAGEPAFIMDINPTVNLTLNLDSSIVHFYGGGGTGGGSNTVSFGNGGNGGDAIQLSGDGVHSLDFNISNTNGIDTGKIFAGGGGGGAGSGNGGNPQSPCGGGGGASGWFAGIGGVASGGSVANTPGSNGGVYDSNNGGSNDPNVAGGAGGTTGGTGGGAGGALGANGSGASGGGSTGGLAVNRGSQPGTTTIVSGGGTNNIRGTVQ
jgi:hypothetical protein